MYAFIGGMPAAGKTFLVEQFVKRANIAIQHVELDKLRETKDFRTHPLLHYWDRFYWNHDEKEYWTTTSYQEHIQNQKKQAKAFWPKIIETIRKTIEQHEHAIFEGVYLLPELVRRDIAFPGCYLVIDDYKEVMGRVQADPRWGKTEELQQLEAKYFIDYDGRFIKEQAKKYDYKVFDNASDAEQELQRIFANS